MKAITIQQPYAALIAEGIKEYEFRTWKTAYRGPLLIHAGKGMDKKACSRFALYNLDYLAGAVIAKAELTDCMLWMMPFAGICRRKIRKFMPVL